MVRQKDLEMTGVKNMSASKEAQMHQEIELHKNNLNMAK